jgi:4-amino-4-deoxy-L-arabinose transferase-like glycosyltransferase
MYMLSRDPDTSDSMPLLASPGDGDASVVDTSPDSADPGDDGAPPPAVSPHGSDGHAADTAADSTSVLSVLHTMEATLARIEGRLAQGAARRHHSAAPSWAFALPRPLSEQLTWFRIAALATALLVVFLRLVNLDQLQNELYGDIALIYEYVAAIQARHWPFYFTLSAGPLYHYLIMPVVAITGPTYYGFKLASVLVSLGALAATYALSRRLIDERFALLTTLVAGVSSWLLIFSRLGNSQILGPLLATCALWLAVRVVQGGSARHVIACAVVSTLGLYVYPPSFVLAPAIGLTLLGLRWTGMSIKWADLRRFAITAFVTALPFVGIVARDPHNFFSGYIGGKLDNSDWLAALFHNLISGLLAFHVRGDSIFRSNPVGLPHLDWISGLLFLGGLVFWLLPERRRLSPVLLIPLVLLQAPSWLVLNQPAEVPSASRTLGVAPIVYILVASGLWWLVQARRAGLPRWLGPALAGVLVVAIVLLNAQRYFRDYIGGLPYQNTPIGRIMATYLDALPPETQIYLVGCCWEDSMPEPLSVQYVMARPERFSPIDPGTVTCDWLRLQPQPTVLVWSFHNAIPSPQVEACNAWLPAQLYASKAGLPVFYAAPVRPDLAAGPAGAALAPPAPGDAELETKLVEIDGQTVRARYSPPDIGAIGDLFDQSDDTLLRSRDANPMVLVLEFARPRSVSAIGLTLAAMQHVQITIKLTDAEGKLTTFTRDLVDLGGIPVVDLPVPSGPVVASQVRIEILDLAPPAEGTHIHVRELRLH